MGFIGKKGKEGIWEQTQENEQNIFRVFELSGTQSQDKEHRVIFTLETKGANKCHDKCII